MVSQTFLLSGEQSAGLEKRQGVLSGCITSRRMDILEPVSFGILVPAVSEPYGCALLRQPRSQGRMGMRSRDGALLRRVEAGGPGQGAEEAVWGLGREEPAEAPPPAFPSPRCLRFFPRKRCFSVSHGLGETFLEVRQWSQPQQTRTQQPQHALKPPRRARFPPHTP